PPNQLREQYADNYMCKIEYLSRNLAQKENLNPPKPNHSSPSFFNSFVNASHQNLCFAELLFPKLIVYPSLNPSSRQKLCSLATAANGCLADALACCSPVATLPSFFLCLYLSLTTKPRPTAIVFLMCYQLLQEMGRTGGVAVDGSFFQSLFNGLVKEGEIQGSVRAGVHWTPAAFANEAKGYDSGRLNESNEMATANLSESDPDNQEQASTKSKKTQRKSKDTSSQTSDSKSGSRKELVKMKDDNLSSPSEEWIVQKITTLFPEFEEQGLDDPETILEPSANKLRPTKISSWMEKRKALLTENADRMKRLLDNLQKKLDEVVLHRHLLGTVAAPMVDMLFHDLNEQNKLKNGVELQEAPSSESILVSPGDRVAISKSFPRPLADKALAVVEALEGKVGISNFATNLVVKPLKRLDKKLERTLLHSYRKGVPSEHYSRSGLSNLRSVVLCGVIVIIVSEKLGRLLIFGKGHKQLDFQNDERRKRLGSSRNQPGDVFIFWSQVWPDQKIKLKLKALYMHATGLYSYSIFALIFWETRRSDFGVSMGHHVATFILIVLSYIFRFARVGSVVLALHDASDVFLEIGKMSKYSGAETIASIAFILFILSWVLLRLIYYPFWILWST
ncbi:hypothetical protein S245_020408, partial [Arachis hypogaea]